MGDVNLLPNRTIARYLRSTSEPHSESFMTLRWTNQPRNILMVPKLQAPHVMTSMIEAIKYLWTNYPKVKIVMERRVATEVHGRLPCPVYVGDALNLPKKIDMVATFGGDGTILRAARLFAMEESLPPLLCFSMGTLGFLGEWKFDEYKRAFREAYMSGSGVPAEDLQGPHTRYASASEQDFTPHQGLESTTWEGYRGKSMGAHRGARMLLRHRIKVGVFNEAGQNITGSLAPIGWVPDQSTPNPPVFHAVNELLIHRGGHPHLAIMDIYINNQFLTEAIADGMLLSTPTGSTAYSLSAGGAIVHPWVESILLTPICPRSLSFRPLVLPINAKVSLRLSKKNRGRDLEMSIDGTRLDGVSGGMEIRVEGERLHFCKETNSWAGGVPCIVRVPSVNRTDGQIVEDHDGWVGGLNGLLKFNYGFGGDEK
ncbi:hypothetical protein TD95_002798 [Thielaviopsis punctulata]|uniref:Uncharacterized protein n=1 Tax=Thielaviopsis punctulata TaxID=72032 RepID=A0A0F4ZJY1_9PEZI|nr:hypothetical protein TD95_002798 [Thielaviopsis punctulata]